EVGKAFGRARAATGFSMDLRQLVAAAPAGDGPSRILAPYLPRNAALQRRIEALRRRGEIVIEDLPGHAAARSELTCDRRLVRRGGRWIIVK
ncbi:MAG TPA: ATP phosphoribosyltransferase regulatory subunit, partial [Burkholderiales bacterium]|nr:ATP phosphoribosyltransferase regulatory subunit [Burkholderiales bacterium]